LAEKIYIYGAFWLGILKEGQPLGRPSRQWEDNVKRILKKYNLRSWINLAQDRDKYRSDLWTKYHSTPLR
jgi:hypothetical protein